MPKILKKTKGQLKASVRNLREGARRAIEDTAEFVRENPKFGDYYSEDMAAVKRAQDGHYGKVSEEEHLLYRLYTGLTSPGTRLTSNVREAVSTFDLFNRDGDLRQIVVGKTPKGGATIKESPFSFSASSGPNKARSLKVVDRLVKEKGSIRAAIDYLEEGVPMKELNKFNREMGYSGGIGEPGQTRNVVKAATGQDKLIPRIFIFGPKVGAYSLNALGNHRFNTIDVWEARFIRSYFKGMFDKNYGLPEGVNEHKLMIRFTEMFKEELELMTGEKFETSSLQALRWFYMIDTAKKLGYKGAGTNDTISHYTQRYLAELGTDPQGGRQRVEAPRERVRSQAPQAEARARAQAQELTSPDAQFMPAAPQPRQAPGPAARQAPQGNRFMVPKVSSANREQLERFMRN